MVPKGIILDCLCVLLGTNLGSAIKNHIPARINQPMNVIFGLSAIAIGITSCHLYTSDAADDSVYV